MKKSYWLILAVLADIIIFIALIFLMVKYNDFYSDDEEQYFKWATLSVGQKLIYVFYIGWITVNFITFVYFLIMIIRNSIQNKL